MESYLRVAAELENLGAIRRFVQEAAAALETDPAVIPDVLLAVDEAATNIIIHGYRGRSGLVELEVSRADDALVIRLHDRATPFDPTEVPPPDLTLPLEQRPVGGMGIYLMQQLMDEVTYRTTPQGGNWLTMLKRGVFDLRASGA